MRLASWTAAIAACCMIVAWPLQAAPQNDAPRLPSEPSWRTFARPLALGSTSMLLFQRAGSSATVWRTDAATGQVTSFTLPDLKLEDGSRYTAVSTSQGLWLLGPRTLLIRPDGQHLVADTGYDEPVAVALADGSVGVFGKSIHGVSGGFVIQQLRADASASRIDVVDRGPLSYALKPNDSSDLPRFPNQGHTALRLADDRVLLVGGNGTPTLAGRIEPRPAPGAWTVTRVAPSPHARRGAAAVLLADGRVAVAGTQTPCDVDADTARSVDLYDPATDRWTTLPPLPFAVCVTTTEGVHGPAIAVTPAGDLVVGAHLEPHVMVLRRDAASASGFAASWTVHGQFPLAHIGGSVQAPSNDEVLVAGGVDSRATGCCQATPGVDRVAIGAAEQQGSRALRYDGVGVARRGALVFAAGGRSRAPAGDPQLAYSAYAELLDLRSGTARQLPNLPFVSANVQARWIDDGHVLVKGQDGSVGRIVGGQDAPADIPPSSGALAVFDVRQGRWNDVIDIPELGGSALLDVVGNDALLLSPDALLRLDLKTRRVTGTARLASGRTGGSARLVGTNRLVAAGGEALPALSVTGHLCPSGHGACEEQGEAIAPFGPSTGMESIAFGPGLDVRRIDFTGNQAPDLKASTVTIARDGAVTMLVSDQNGGAPRLVRRLPGESRWRDMPAPPGVDACNDCALLTATDPRDPARELLFWRLQRAGDTFPDAAQRPAIQVWLWDEAPGKWRRVLRTDALRARVEPAPLAPDVLAADGKPILSMGWHLDTPLLWVAP